MDLSDYYMAYKDIDGPLFWICLQSCLYTHLENKVFPVSECKVDKDNVYNDINEFQNWWN